MSLAPIVLFVYNRPRHTQQTIEALQKNELAQQSELFIYSDGAKNCSAQQAVDEVRVCIKSIDGFKKIIIIEREGNWGLADSIIDGVTTIVNQYGKVIVLEDDLVTSPYFLTFMNDALNFYQEEEKVWHVSGWNYPINSDGLDDAFLWRVMNCWGWGTWSDRWQHYERDVNSDMSAFSNSEIKKFNLDGVENFFAQMEANKQKKIKTWAVFWYACIFKNKGLCLNPVQTFVDNIGHDGSGVNCGEVKEYTDSLNMKENFLFINEMNEDVNCLVKVKGLLKTPIKERIINMLSWK